MTATTPGGYIARSRLIAREMIPGLGVWIKSAIRIGVGAALMLASGYVPVGGDWLQFAGKMFVVLALIGFVGHAEGVFIEHAAAKARLEGGRVVGWWRGSRGGRA